MPYMLGCCSGTGIDGIITYSFMNIDRLLKYATLYYLYSFADLRSNMVLRILHSLIPQIVHLEDPQMIQEHLATQLIPGAREVIAYGTQAVAAEYETIHANNETEVKAALAQPDPINGLRMAVDGFRTNAAIGYGGEPWAKFAEALLNLKNQIDIVERTGSPAHAQQLTAYLNQIDGMMHNTGDFMEKMVQQEGGYMTNDTQEDMRRLRDISRLPAEHVISLMEPESKDADYYRQLFREHRRHHPVQEGDYGRAQQALREFQEQRRKENLTPEPLSVYKGKKKAPPPPPRRNRNAS